MRNSDMGKLTIYVDCVSPYSWFGFTNIVRFRPLLQAHGVHVEIMPFFLGGARDSVGNPYSPPLPAKAAFASQDTEMTARLLGLRTSTPEVFPISSLFPVRVATWIKDHYAAEKFEQTFLALVSGYWSKGIDISKPDGVIQALGHLFSAEEIRDIMKQAMAPENKKRVIDLTMSAGAFGAPWIVALNKQGEKRSWFGNDRWEQIFFHLGVPYSPLRIVPPEGAKAKM
ncbi:glutathione S-transferase [Corynespora cassiicola Philippines]|uniref:Glutathione S-transferase n=1 Tax=Corynespora cassiicola Philippines TaxID=1448308 RepID=A0A2T2NLD4_CORCC|nr:glutathione S-transferase [Corynespora cassiicola Philippines]